MKRLYISGALVSGTSPVFSAVGTHNFVINAGGGVSVSTTQLLEYFDSKKHTAQEIQEQKANFLGGLVSVQKIRY